MRPHQQRALQRLRERQNNILSAWIVRVLTVGFWLSLTLIVVGIAIALLRWEQIGTEAAPLPEVVGGALDGNQQAVVDLGILVLLLTPPATVVVALISAIAQRDRFLGIVSAALLVIALLGLMVGL